MIDLFIYSKYYSGLPLALLPKMIENKINMSGLRRRLTRTRVGDREGYEVKSLYKEDELDDQPQRCILGEPFSMVNLSEEAHKVNILLISNASIYPW